MMKKSHSKSVRTLLDPVWPVGFNFFKTCSRDVCGYNADVGGQSEDQIKM